MELDLETDDRREQLIFGEPIDWDAEDQNSTELFGDYYDGTAIEVETARTLIEEGYVDPEFRQNYSPQFGEMVEWGEKTEAEYDVTVSFEGYVISPHRPDARISFTTIVVDANEGDLERALIAELGETFGDADEANIGEDHADFWWD